MDARTQGQTVLGRRKQQRGRAYGCENLGACHRRCHTIQVPKTLCCTLNSVQ